MHNYSEYCQINSVYDTVLTEREEQSTQFTSEVMLTITYIKANSTKQVEETFQGHGVGSSTSILDLSIEFISLTAENMAALSASLTISKTLHRLTFWSCDLDDHAVEQLSAGLKESTSLNGLDVSSNLRITDTGSKNLAIMLTENSTLHKLCLSHNQAITDTGAVSLSRGEGS